MNIELTPKQAYLIKGMVQNGPENEDELHATLREQIFHKLPGFNELISLIVAEEKKDGYVIT
jgi:hypothetical protein